MTPFYSGLVLGLILGAPLGLVMLWLVAHVVATLQRVPEVSEVWVVGDAARLAATLEPLRPELCKPLHVVPQFRNLY